MKARMPGLYYALSLVARIEHRAEFEELLVRDRWKALSTARKLYGEEATSFLLKVLEEACF